MQTDIKIAHNILHVYVKYITHLNMIETQKDERAHYTHAKLSLLDSGVK